MELQCLPWDHHIFCSNLFLFIAFSQHGFIQKQTGLIYKYIKEYITEYKNKYCLANSDNILTKLGKLNVIALLESLIN